MQAHTRENGNQSNRNYKPRNRDEYQKLKVKRIFYRNYMVSHSTSPFYFLLGIGESSQKNINHESIA